MTKQSVGRDNGAKNGKGVCAVPKPGAELPQAKQSLFKSTNIWNWEHWKSCQMAKRLEENY